MNNLEELIEYYVNLLIIQYHNKPKARATIRIFISELLKLYKLIKEVESAFDLDRAIGSQLDTVGKYFGVVRNFVGLKFNYQYFTTQYLGGNDEGVSFNIIGQESEGKTRTLYGEKTYQYDLDDEQFRTLIKLRDIALHNETLSLKYIQDLCFHLLKGQVYITPTPDEVMSLDFYFRDTNLLQIFQTYDNLLPAPAGVKVNVYEMGKFDEVFTFKVLTVNGGRDYNIHQCGFQSLISRNEGKWKTIPIEEE